MFLSLELQWYDISTFKFQKSRIVSLAITLRLSELSSGYLTISKIREAETVATTFYLSILRDLLLRDELVLVLEELEEDLYVSLVFKKEKRNVVLE
jgi:hypothetical protein